LTATLFELIRVKYFKSEPARDEKGNFGDLTLTAGDMSVRAGLDQISKPVAEMVDGAIGDRELPLTELSDRIQARRVTSAANYNSFKTSVSNYICERKWIQDAGSGRLLLGAI